MTDFTDTELPLDNTTDTTVEQYDPAHDYHALNAMLNLYDADGRIQFGKDKAAEREYVTGHVATNTKRFESTGERLRYLIDHQYYAPAVFERYSPEFLDDFYAHAESSGFEFGTFLGAFKFYTSYALKTFDGKLYLEDFPQRCAAVALELAAGNEQRAVEYLDEMLSGAFQPATPTFLNLGKAQRGEAVSCFLVRIEDSMESISRGINAALQLSKRGGGVALLLSNLRELGAPIKHIENQSSGVIPVMKLLEDSFSYANQLGARQGAGAVYLNAHHPDILRFLDTKRENADEKIRIKSLALGVVIPDVTFELAKKKAKMALFSPYDAERVYGKPFADISVTEHYDEMVADDRIRKTYIDAREFFTTLAEIQFESGYPYIVFEDTVNRANPIAGRITMSNLCSEILQVQEASSYNEDLTYSHVGRDVSCNLGSLNIAKAMDAGLAGTVETAIRALTSVSEHTRIDAVPSICRANDEGHAIGLGQMNLHGFLAREGIQYGSEEALDFTDMYFMTVAYHAYRASHTLAVEHGTAFRGFADSAYAKPAGEGNYFDKYTDSRRSLAPRTELVRALFERFGVAIPTEADWAELRDDILRDGIYNQNLQAVPPTGSISYINHSTSSIHPIASKIEIRKEGKLGRVYYPAAYMTNENLEYYKDAYEIGWKAIVDTYAEATQHVDQGLSLTLFFPDTATTRDLNKAQIYAWRKGIKTLYYIRIRQQALEGTEVQGCVSCTL
ncbi:class 1b ribonucleoside-diphosphate reductase subunit alpha [Bifidobacterium bifidum]|uniref:class 1b ribonucleoside-diphosphate reductase subunit alpha n=1 Tax=Bifidobacterium bifidum TaxID=1681 RepID=UPI001106E01F|nr:class 1b ribonucleoside-diphosphate reductase subunit alpha [Bifidobacterium bifidum]MDB1199540.1 class 1b ribonucleoside-diphosphate reductase subunit alpha [Bifidobacterium bifidum]MDB1201720.1 class 1b ribonucleoside-diphosphate reductase subunit alpha [Bifidobacterium bifidum]MDB1203744.1 class 1b ribonucleoside-diphosphate reductase subunit alpha [Bifidobacterium bifidum]MDB1206318.1 class 1b ribonucleoside-diphosphate reductase subunit alpha [Bifidobacterium bifidum]MDB1208610.1 class